jgi:hypothetical protein
MAFTGTPVLTKVTDKLFRITGVSLAAAAVGRIAFSDYGGVDAIDVTLDAPNWQPSENETTPVGLQDVVMVSVVPDLSAVVVAIPVAVVKTGTTHADFVITLTNTTAAEGAISSNLEIYVELGGH